jgi:hypothetical protein
MDISDEVKEFVDHVDMSVEDTSYQIPGIIEYYTTVASNRINTIDVIKLANRFYGDRIVKSASDAEIIADYAIRELYPAITSMLYELGYVTADTHQVNYTHNNARRYIVCRVMMRVL